MDNNEYWRDNEENQGIPDVYGWIEMGGATSEETFLNHTSSIDILVRTIHIDSMIVLGNTKSESCDAGVYIRDNRIGIAGIPATDERSNVNLNIHGDTDTDGTLCFKTNEETRRNSFQSNVNYEVNANSSNIMFTTQLIGDFGQENPTNLVSTNMNLSAQGLIQNKLIVTDSIHLNIDDEVKNIYIKEFTPNDINNIIEAGYNLQVEYSFTLTTKFVIGGVFIVDNTQFRVVNEPKLLGTATDNERNLSMDVVLVFPEDNFKQLPISRDTFANITFYQALKPPVPSGLSNIIKSELISRITNVSSYVLSTDKKTIDLEISLAVYENEEDPFEGKYVSQREEFFQKGYYYYFQNEELEYEAKQNIDKIVKCSKAEPIIKPGNIKRMRLSFSAVDNMPIDGYFRTMIQGFDIVNAEENQLHFYLLDIPFQFGFDNPKPILAFIDEGSNVVSSSTVKYTIRSQDNTFLFNYLLNEDYRADYINDAIYIMEPVQGITAIWEIEKFEPIDLLSGVITLSTTEFEIDEEIRNKFNQSRSVNIFLFRLKVMNRIGDFFHDAFIPYKTRFAIGTTNCSELLTVNGTASLRDHLVMYNHDSVRPLHISFQKNNGRINLDDTNNNSLSLTVENDPPAFSNLRFVDFRTSKSLLNDEDKENHNEDVLVNADIHFIRDAMFSKDYDTRKKPSKYFKIDGDAISSVINDNKNISLDLFGNVKTGIINANDFQTEMFTLKQIEIIEVFLDEEFYDLMHNKINGPLIKIDVVHKMHILPYDLINIKGSVFRVLKTNIPLQDPDFRYLYVYLEWYFPQEKQFYQSEENPFLSKKQKVDITVYRGLETKNKTRAFIYFKLESFEFETDVLGKHIFLNVAGTIPTMEKMFLSVGRFYCIRRESERPGILYDDVIENVLILKAISHIGRDDFVLEFKSIDNMTDLKHDTSLGHDMDFTKMRNQEPNIFIYPLNSFFQPNRRQFPYNAHKSSVFPYEKRVESGVNISYSAEADDRFFINLENATELSRLVSDKTRFMINPIDRLYTERGVYDVAGIYNFDNYVKVWAKFVNTNYLKTANDTTISYGLSGIPFKVNRVEYPGDDISIIYYLEDVEKNTYELLKLYQGKTIYIMDKFNIPWSLTNIFRTYKQINGKQVELTILTVTDTRSIEKVRKLTSQDRIDLANERYIFVIPLQYFDYHKIADDQSRNENFAPKSLGIGTQFIKETLTVEGTMSCKDQLVLYDDNSFKPFTMTYGNDVMNINDKLQITNSNVSIKSDFEIDGVFSASAYLTTSDDRLKENITKTDIYADLDTINKLAVHSFNFKNETTDRKEKRQKVKGVIAQEVEELLPEIVSTKLGIIPNIMKKGKVILDNDGKMAILLQFFGQVMNEHENDNDNNNREKDLTDFENITSILKKGLRLSMMIKTVKSTKESKNAKEICVNLEDFKIKTIVNDENKQNQQCHNLYLYIDTIDTKSLDLYTNVFINGVYDDHKVVDYSYLFMTNINALKALHQEVEKIKLKLEHM